MRLLIFVILSLFISAPSFAENTIHDDQIKIWAYKAVSRLLTYRYDELESNLDQNKYLLTERGCKKYLWILDSYGFADDLKDHGETLIVEELWKNKAFRSELDLITLERLTEREEKIKETENVNHKFWYADIPLILVFQKGLIKKRYRFIAYVQIRMVNDNPATLLIENWLITPLRGVISRKEYIKYSDKNYDECDDVSFKDIED